MLFAVPEELQTALEALDLLNTELAACKQRSKISVMQLEQEVPCFLICPFLHINLVFATQTQSLFSLGKAKTKVTLLCNVVVALCF